MVVYYLINPICITELLSWYKSIVYFKSNRVDRKGGKLDELVIGQSHNFPLTK